MDKKLASHIETILGSPIKGITSVSGGDIAQAYRIDTVSDRYFCKLLRNPEGYEMLRAESEGLKTIQQTNTIKTPEVYRVDSWEENAILIMEFIDSRRPSSAELKLLGRQLAALHLQQRESFGWDRNNYIGSLQQFNNRHDNWAHFYILERLEPQFELSLKLGMLHPDEIPSSSVMIEVMGEYCEAVVPVLLHGDLWGGNYMINDKGIPYLIDPAVYCGHSEVDIAMSQLFGGFGDEFYKGYYEVLPEHPLSKDRLKLYQLYYLLVHLNLFGRSYYSSVRSIIKTYF